MLPENERHSLPEACLRLQLTTFLADRAAENMLLGSVSSCADDDARRATELACSMAARWEMLLEIGPVDRRESEDHPFLGQQIGQSRTFAVESAARVDQVAGQITRIEVHLIDANANKIGQDDKHCMIESCLEGRLLTMQLRPRKSCQGRG